MHSLAWRTIVLLIAAVISAPGCGGSSPSQPTPPPPPATAALAAPQATSPVGGQSLTDTGVTLTVTNAQATGTVSNVRYRFEWSELDSFPADSRTGTKQDVAQGNGSTAYTITDTLTPNQRLFWRARAYTDAVTGDWSRTESFVTANKGFIRGQSLYDPLTTGETVGQRFGGTFVAGQGWRADSDTDGIDYPIQTCSACTLQFDVTNFGRAEGAPAFKDYKWISMGDGSTFGDFNGFRDHPWKMHLEQRSDGDGTGMKIVWRNGAASEGGNPGDHTLRNDQTVDWRSNVVYRFTLRWDPSGYSVDVGIVNADGSVSNNQNWFRDGFGGLAYAPPGHRVSLGTRSRFDTMRGAIWRNVRLDQFTHTFLQ
jgi:hypothetical protein